MNTQLTPEQRKQRIETALKITGVGVVGFLVAPFVLTAIGGILGLAIAAGISFTAVNMLPWFALKVSNWRLKAIKSEAMKNPVETLQTEYVKKESALKEFKENIRIFAGQVLGFGDQVKQYVKEGLEDAQVYVDQLGKMKKLLEIRQQKYQEAKQALEEFADTIEKTNRKWKMALAAMAMNEAAGQMEGDAFDKICIETALESVQTKLNQSFADLEIALLDNVEKSEQKKVEMASVVNDNKTQTVVNSAFNNAVRATSR
jgi:hypothetical protein